MYSYGGEETDTRRTNHYTSLPLYEVISDNLILTIRCHSDAARSLHLCIIVNLRKQESRAVAWKEHDASVIINLAGVCRLLTQKAPLLFPLQ